MKKVQSKRKRWPILIGVMLVLMIILTMVIGNFFVNYALVPGEGGQNRHVTTNLQVDKPTVIEQNRHMVQLEVDHWLEKVEALTEEVMIQSHDGLDLKGVMYHQAEASDLWVVIVHGYQSNAEWALDYAPYYYNQGYNILSISLRAHEPSQGNYIGMGYLDKEDLLSWTNFLIGENKQAAIVYHGVSMGGATVLMASGLKELPDNVKLVVSDCAYSSVWDIFSSELNKRFGLPSFPVLNMSNAVAQVRAGYSLRAGEVIDYVNHSQLPTLFIHGDKDDFVPVEMAYTLYEAKAIEEKQLIVIDDAGHAEAHLADPEKYYSAITEFITSQND